jgi:class 3 adenylate cyclase
LSRPGKKVEIVYSICRIRKFTDTTECLQAEIIVFVNKIVRIVHLCASHWEGKPTKNDGDRYMITWKLPTYDQAAVHKVDEIV